MIASLRFQVGLLAGLQALLLTNNATLIAVNALAGMQLTDNKLFATLPVTGYVIGGAVWSMPAAYVMKRFGRRAGYSIGSVAAILGAMIAGYAMAIGSLWLLCFATFVCGLYNAFGVSFRFAAADVADAFKPSFKARAISLVLTGGIAGGIFGPEVSRWSRTALPQEFAGTYLMLGVFALCSLIIVQWLRVPAPPASSAATAPPRPLAEIFRQPAALVALASAALGYGIMNLLMVATPLAMEVCSLPFDSAVFVLQWHIVGMFAPGLFTGALIARFGVFQVIIAGALMLLACVFIALSGVELIHFAAALFLLGVGWNFMYTGGTTLLTTTYRPHEKNKVQGFMDTTVFIVMVTSSASSGALLFVNGWSVLNLISLPFVVLVIVGAVWAASRLGWGLGQVRAAAG
ncbi:MAG: Riboflavin transporter RfnT [Pseudomonadota bacterium]|jgi:MFS family permease